MTIGGAPHTEQLLTFRLDREVFAVDVARVREVVQRPRLTRLPGVPAWALGVMNLRGTVVAVVDLSPRIGLRPIELHPSRQTWVIVLELSVDGANSLVGVLAEAVLDVVDAAQATITAPPDFGNDSAHRRRIVGVGRRGQQVFAVLDLERLFGLVASVQGILAAEERPTAIAV